MRPVRRIDAELDVRPSGLDSDLRGSRQSRRRRITWYSRSVKRFAPGPRVMESPVVHAPWDPKFSMEQMMMTLSLVVAPSTSSSYSFPAGGRISSIRHSWTGREIKAGGRGLSSALRGCRAMRRGAAEGEAWADDDGEARFLPANSDCPSFRLLTSCATSGHQGRCRCMASLKTRRSSAFLMALICAPDQMHVVLFEHAAVGEFRWLRLSAGLSAKRRQDGKPALWPDNSRSTRMIS